MKTGFLPLLSLLVALLPNSPACAEKAPLTVDQMQIAADAIVLATVEQIRIESEPSRFERGIGNSDWGIYLTLKVETVEKGNVSDEILEARCFRIRSRRSVMEYITPSGHHPIPAIGTRVRANLKEGRGTWDVVLPNGITSVQDVHMRSGADFQDAAEITQLRSRYTFLFPLELWLLAIFVGVPIFLGITLGIRWLRRRRERERLSNAT